jgi:AraC family transcriptional activator of pyochelin receptor
MQIHLKAARAGEIALSPELPASLRGLRAPESRCFGAAGPFGHVLFQALDGEGISIRHSILYFEQGDMVHYRSEEPALRLQVVLNNSYYAEAEGLGEMVLHERGFSINYVPFVHQRLQVRARGSYTHLSVYYRPEDLEGLQSSFPALTEFLRNVREGKAAIYNPIYCIAKGPMMMLVHNILDCPYAGTVRRLYLNSLSMELLVLALVRIRESGTNGHHIPVSREEVERVYATKDLVMRMIDLPFSMPGLMEVTGQTAYKLNRSWRAVYGMGVVDWVHEMKMEVAHHSLQDTEIPLQDIAEAAGYTSITAFTLGFKKHFGYAPGFVRKSGSN